MTGLVEIEKKNLMTASIVSPERHDLKAIYMEPLLLDSEVKRKCSHGPLCLTVGNQGINRRSSAISEHVRRAYLTPGVEGTPISPRRYTSGLLIPQHELPTSLDGGTSQHR